METIVLTDWNNKTSANLRKFELEKLNLPVDLSIYKSNNFGVNWVQDPQFSSFSQRKFFKGVAIN